MAISWPLLGVTPHGNISRTECKEKGEGLRVFCNFCNESWDSGLIDFDRTDRYFFSSLGALFGELALERL